MAGIARLHIDVYTHLPAQLSPQYSGTHEHACTQAHTHIFKNTPVAGVVVTGFFLLLLSLACWHSAVPAMVKKRLLSALFYSR